MYCPTCKEERSGKFCHICGTELVENRQIDTRINIGDGNVMKDIQFNHQVNNVSNVTNNLVERPKTTEELKMEAEELFAKLCKKVFEDGILTGEERNLLKSRQLELGLSDEKAAQFIEQFRKVSKYKNTVLSANAIAALEHCDKQIKNNDIKKISSLLLRLKTLAEKYDIERVQFLYYMVLAAIKPEELIKEYEDDIIDKYWKTYWVAIAYQKIGKGEKSFEAIERLEIFVENTEDNCILLNAIELYNTDGPEAASDCFNSIIPESCSILLREVVQAMSVVISLGNAEDVKKYKFYIDNIITFESQTEKEAKRRVEGQNVNSDAKYCFAIGEEYFYGRNGKNISYKDAIEWYFKAAEQGNADAQYKLGVCYEKGDGVAQSLSDAIKWYCKASEQGHTLAQYSLGLCYENGRGIARSWADAVKWYRKAAEHGYAAAEYKLGCCYENGNGVPLSCENAVKWFEKAAARGNAEAKIKLDSYRNIEKGKNNDAVSGLPKDYIDLGLPSGLKWAKCNIGANKPEEYGDYYAWGEIESKKEYSIETYIHINKEGSWSRFWNGMYMLLGDIGEKEYDVARNKWGDNWRLPTRAEFQELKDCCIWEWTIWNGKCGYMVTSKKNGNAIFLPANGRYNGTSLMEQENCGNYWSASPASVIKPDCSYCLHINNRSVCVQLGARVDGYNVRPVCK